MTANIPSLRCCGDGPRIQQQRPKSTRGIDTDATNDRRQGRRRHLHRRAMPIVPLPPIFHRADRDRAKPCPRISCGGGQEVYSDAPSRGKISSSFFQHTNSYIILQKLQLPNKLIPTSAGPPEVGKFNFPGSCLILARTRGGLIVESLRWMPTSPPLH